MNIPKPVGISKSEIKSCHILAKWYQFHGMKLAQKSRKAGPERWILEAASSHFLEQAIKTQQAALNGGADEIRSYLSSPLSMDEETMDAWQEQIEPKL